MLKNRFNLK